MCFAPFLCTLLNLSVMLALCSCALPTANTAATTEQNVPKNWRSQEFALTNTVPDLQNWWLRFADPSLTTLIERALAANTSITGARATLRQSYALRDIARAALSPVTNASLSAQRNTAGNAAYNTYATTLNGTWVLDAFGARQSAADATAASAQASAATLGAIQTAIAQEMAAGYVLLRASQVRLSIARQNASSQAETLQITQWRLQAGLIGESDVAQARAALEQTYALLPVLQATIEKTGNLLATLANLNAADLSSLITTQGAVTIPAAAQDGTLGTPQDTLLQRADVRAAQFQVTRALALIAQAKAQRMPTFTLGASVGANAGTTAALSDSNSSLGAISASMVLPLTDGGAARAQVRSQEAALQLARSNYQAAVASALQEVEDALTALRTDRERLLRLRNAASSASDAASMALSRYSSGLADFQVVLETQRTQFSTQDSVAGASSDIATDQVNLFKALGGGWQAASLDEDNTITTISTTLPKAQAP